MSEEQFTGPVSVNKVEASSTGKSWRVLLGGNWYGAYKDSGILEALQKSIYVVTGTTEKGGPWILKWRVADQTTALATAPSATPSAPPVAPHVKAPSGKATPLIDARTYVAPWWAPFMSNTIAHCITSGLITKPEQIGAWARAAMETAIALAAGEEASEDEIPF